MPERRAVDLIEMGPGRARPAKLDEMGLARELIFPGSLFFWNNKDLGQR